MTGKAAIRGVGFAAPGLVGWKAARECLAGISAYTPEPLPKLAAEWLPANERRRLSALMRLALNVGQEAVRGSEIDPELLATVFASATGDGHIIHGICQELTRHEPALSPTQFHNSVHNAPAGYWSIAAASQAASTAVAAHDVTFAVGLVEAITLSAETGAPVLMIAYDQPLPFPLGQVRVISAPFACAFVLDARAAHPPQVTMRPVNDMFTSRLQDPALEALRIGNPAARALPLLALLARETPGTVTVPYLPTRSLALEFTAV